VQKAQRRLGAAPRHQRVHGDHDEEEHGRGYRQERDHGVQEVAVPEHAAIDREGEAREIVLAENRGDDRRDQIRHEGGDDRAKSGADDNSHREVDDVAAQQEGLELPEHALGFVNFATNPALSREAVGSRWSPARARRACPPRS
jgi:hypothetical protein